MCLNHTVLYIAISKELILSHVHLLCEVMYANYIQYRIPQMCFAIPNSIAFLDASQVKLGNALADDLE